MSDTPAPLSEAELKPCPFCGGTSLEVRDNGIGDCYVICYSSELDVESCGARTSDVDCETHHKAISRWNTRHIAATRQPAASVAEVERAAEAWALRAADYGSASQSAQAAETAFRAALSRLAGAGVEEDVAALIYEARLVDGLRGHAHVATGQAKGYMLDAADLIDRMKSALATACTARRSKARLPACWCLASYVLMALAWHIG